MRQSRGPERDDVKLYDKSFLSIRFVPVKLLLVAIAVVFVGIGISGAEFAANRVGAMFFSFIFPFAADILRLFRIRVPADLELTYLVFLLFAQYLGIDFNAYKWLPHYDKVIHAVSGALTVVVGYMLWSYFKLPVKSKSIDVRALFAILLAISVAAVWEYIEFAADKLLGMNMQTLISEGVDDTMFDMIFATIGAIIAVAAYKYVLPKLKPRKKRI